MLLISIAVLRGFSQKFSVGFTVLPMATILAISEMRDPKAEPTCRNFCGMPTMGAGIRPWFPGFRFLL
jgi:hypothetical protein